MSYRFGDVVLLDYPFTDGLGVKRRPGLVLLVEKDGDVLFARVTSKERENNFDLSLEDWKAAGLAYPSMVRLSKMVSLHENLILRRIGNLTEKDRSAVLTSLQQMITQIE